MAPPLYSAVHVFRIVLVLLGSANSTFVNVSITSTNVRIGGSFNVTIDFSPTSFSNGLDSVKCGYELGNSAFVTLAEWSIRRSTLEVVASGFPASYIGRLTIPSAKVIKVSNVKFKDEGTNYHCQMKYVNGSGMLNTINSSRVRLANVYSEPIFGQNTLQRVAWVVEDSNNILHCSVISRPASTVTWSYDSGIVASASNSTKQVGYYTHSIGALTIIGADLSLKGKAVNCTGTPKYGGAIVRTSSLLVLYKPISTNMTFVTLKPVEKSRVVINCSARAKPDPNFKFYRFDASKAEIEISSATSKAKGVLVIDNISAPDKSYKVTYKCVPYNNLGKGKAKIVTFDVQVPPKLQANFEPKIINETGDTSLECNVAAANPPADIKAYDPFNNTILLHNGTACISHVTSNFSGSFSCIAYNGVGPPVTKYAELIVQYKPKDVRLTVSNKNPVTGTALTLNCTSQANPKARYRFYEVRQNMAVKEIRSSGFGVITINNMTETNVGGSNVSYRCMAYNVLGFGQSENTEVVIYDPCTTLQPCRNNATCKTQLDGGYICTCITGYTGKNCTVDVNECQSNPCGMNGICIDGIGSYKCVCNNAFTGRHCETMLDPCLRANCTNGICIRRNTTYSCNCYGGYTGWTCDSIIDECSLQPTGVCNEGKCISGNGTIACNCSTGYSGRRCEVDQWPCRSNPCTNGGKCTSKLRGGFLCKCPRGFEGDRCEKKKMKPCDAEPCKNGGTCSELESKSHPGFECACKEGYGGRTCQYFYGDTAVQVTLKLIEESRVFNETAFRIAIAKKLNDYCIKSPTSCPKTDFNGNSPGRYRRDLAKTYVFKQTDVKILPGYPKTTSGSKVVVHFFVAVHTSSGKLGNSTASPGVLSALAPRTVKKALEVKTDTSVYGFQIQSVEVIATTKRKTKEESETTKTLLVIIIVLGSVLVVGFSVVAYLLWWRTRRMSMEVTRHPKEPKINGEKKPPPRPKTTPRKLSNVYGNGGDQQTRKTELWHNQELEMEKKSPDPDYLDPVSNPEDEYVQMRSDDVKA